MSDYSIGDALPCPSDRTAELAKLPTRLADMLDDIQERLINWGFAICDVAMRRWVDPSLPAATAFPYPRGV